MVLRSVKDGDEDAYHALGISFVAVCDGDLAGGVGYGTGKERTGEVTNGGYDHGEVITAVPEAVVGGLIPEDLRISLVYGCGCAFVGGGTSIRPTTMDRLGI